MVEMDLETLESAILAGCSAPECDHEDHGKLYFHATCHPDGEIEVSYAVGTSYLLIACRECKTEVVRIRVAPTSVH